MRDQRDQMTEDDMKSALEIALERARQMEERVSPEKREEVRLAAEGERIADDFLGNKNCELDDMLQALNGYEGEARRAVAEVVVTRLVRAVGLFDADEKVWQGLRALDEKIFNRVKAFLSSYEQAQSLLQKSLEQYMEVVKESQHLGLLPARIDMQAQLSRQNRQSSSMIDSLAKKKLDRLKQELLAEISTG